MAEQLYADMVADKIIKYIVDRKMAANEQLPTNESFAALFGVSRTVVRDALKKLESRGLVRMGRGAGTFVDCPPVAPSLDQLVLRASLEGNLTVQLLEARLALETGIADFVLERATNEQLDTMARCIDEEKELLAKGFDPQAIIHREIDLRFHMAYIEAAHNAAITELGGVIRRFFSLDFPSWTAKSLSKTIEEHEQILAGIRNRQADVMKEVLRRHLERSILLRKAGVY
jgi:GntR family transcriptional repressor for pyruvate dehydrogenase complex